MSTSYDKAFFSSPPTSTSTSGTAPTQEIDCQRQDLRPQPKLEEKHNAKDVDKDIDKDKMAAQARSRLFETLSPYSTSSASPPMLRTQRERWASGCQALFAGFVAVAHLQNKRPTIKDFWGTKQKEMVLPSLVALAAVGGEAGEVMVVDDDDDEEVRAKGAMNAVLLRSDNRYTSPIPAYQAQAPRAAMTDYPGRAKPGQEEGMVYPITPSHKVPSTPVNIGIDTSDEPVPRHHGECADCNGVDREERDKEWETREWKLTREGAKLFAVRAGDVSSVGSGMSDGGVPRWWDM